MNKEARRKEIQKWTDEAPRRTEVLKVRQIGDHVPDVELPQYRRALDALRAGAKEEYPTIGAVSKHESDNRTLFQMFCDECFGAKMYPDTRDHVEDSFVGKASLETNLAHVVTDPECLLQQGLRLARAGL